MTSAVVVAPPPGEIKEDDFTAKKLLRKVALKKICS
jgi:hypothetical protein